MRPLRPSAAEPCEPLSARWVAMEQYAGGQREPARPKKRTGASKYDFFKVGSAGGHINIQACSSRRALPPPLRDDRACCARRSRSGWARTWTTTTCCPASSPAACSRSPRFPTSRCDGAGAASRARVTTQRRRRITLAMVCAGGQDCAGDEKVSGRQQPARRDAGMCAACYPAARSCSSRP